MTVHTRSATARRAKILYFPGAQPAPAVAPPQARNEVRHILIPREHGSWGLWSLPLISGLAVGFARGAGDVSLLVFWFCLAAISAFLAYQPLEVLLGLSPLKARSVQAKRVAWSWSLTAAMLAAVSTWQIFRLGRQRILLFVAIGIGCFAVRWVFGKSRALRAPKQIIGALGLTSSAAGAFYITTGRIDAVALLLWIASWLFAAGQIEFVQLCMHSALAHSRAAKAFAGRYVGIFHIALLISAACLAPAGLVPPLLWLAFVPALVRLLVWAAAPLRKMDFYLLGFSELFQSVLFSSLLVVAFLIHR